MEKYIAENCIDIPVVKLARQPEGRSTSNQEEGN